MRMENGTALYRAWRKDPQRGFAAIVDAMQERLYWHVRRMVVDHQDAEDAVQETFIRIYKGLPTLRDGATLVSWAYRIASNEALRLISKRPQPAEALNEETVDAETSEYFDFSDAETTLLADAVRRLPPRQQLAFNLRYYDEMEYDDMAQVMECSPVTAKTTYHLAKNKITDYIKQAI